MPPRANMKLPKTQRTQVPPSFPESHLQGWSLFLKLKSSHSILFPSRRIEKERKKEIHVISPLRCLPNFTQYFSLLFDCNLT